MLIKIFFLIITISYLAFSQALDIILLNGTAKVQHSAKKDWDNLTIGSQIKDNDIIETFFQTKIIMQFGKRNAIILGSNSKALINIRENTNEQGNTILSVNVTLFSGGCFTKAISNANVSIYTTTAVGQTDSGSFSAIVDAKTGETGFQTFFGNVFVRNIAQKEGIKLISGQTTIIFPSKEPTAPLYMTVKHVSVLKQFFGDEYIEYELKASNINPTEEKTSTGFGTSSMLLQQYGAGIYQGNYQRLFSLDKIWGAIVAEREKYSFSYKSIEKPKSYKEKRIVIEQQNNFSIAKGSLFPKISIIPSFSIKFLSIGLNIPITSNYTQSLGFYNFSSLSGIFDLIHHIEIGPIGDSTLIKIGPIRNYTLGEGTVVDNFNNQNEYLIFNTPGIIAQILFSDFSLHSFIGDISSFSIGGFYFSYSPSIYNFSVGYFFDVNQNYFLKTTNVSYRYILPNMSNVVFIDSSFNAHIYQFGFGTEIYDNYDIKIRISAEFAQKLLKFHNDGFVLKAPIVSIGYKKMLFKTALASETGKLISGQFNSFYPSNRARISSSIYADTLLTSNNIFSSRKRSSKIELYYGINPFKGLNIQAEYKQNIFTNKTFVKDSTHYYPNLSLGCNIAVNDSLWSLIKYGSLYFENNNGGFYPPTSFIPSWGTCAGIDIETNPILFGFGFLGGINWKCLDMNFNNKIDPLDNIIEFYLGIRYGFSW